MDILFFAKTKDGAKIPSKNKEDAGYDIYACTDENIVIEPHKTVLIPTGLSTAFDSNYVMILKERGSTGVLGIGQRSGVIDSGFRGEIMVPITNTRNQETIILDTKVDKVYTDEEKNLHYPTSKAIAQAVMVVIPELQVMEITPEGLNGMESIRGLGMLGSSGK